MNTEIKELVENLKTLVRTNKQTAEQILEELTKIKDESIPCNIQIHGKLHSIGFVFYEQQSALVHITSDESFRVGQLKCGRYLCGKDVVIISKEEYNSLTSK
jgi:hypothetical protein